MRSPKYRRHKVLLRHILMLIAIPLVLMTAGYALFSQQLSINTTTPNVAYTSSQNLLATYTKTVAKSGSSWLYTISMTVKNNGSGAVTAWQVAFDLPTGFNQLSCTNATCTTSGVRVTSVNTATNGTINSGATTTYTITFKTSTTTYVLQNMNVSGTLAPIYQNMAGLTISFTRGARTKSGKWYYWPYTFTVTNNSGQNISAWRATANWSNTTNNVQTMATTVNYVAGATQLTITSKTGMANNTTFQFTAKLGSTSTTWNLTGLAIQGSL